MLQALCKCFIYIVYLPYDLGTICYSHFIKEETETQVKKLTKGHMLFLRGCTGIKITCPLPHAIYKN